MVHITFSGYHQGKKQHDLTYFPDQQFDMTPPGENRGNTMAQRVNIEVLSDLSDKPDASTVTFGLDGTEYEIDLTDDEAGKFRDALAKYVGAARPVRGARKARKQAASATGGPSPKEVREWAQANGHDVPARGRIPAEVREAYDAAH
jgi:hypothetical protein